MHYTALCIKVTVVRGDKSFLTHCTRHNATFAMLYFFYFNHTIDIIISLTGPALENNVITRYIQRLDIERAKGPVLT